jgi:exodeoxyribonuclease VII large subunit
MTPQAISVSQFLGIINETLRVAFPEVIIEGEVSSFKINQGKFVFFDLKDDTNVLSCFMMLHQLRLPIEDGMKVRVTGQAKVTKFSKFSLTVKAIEFAGEGEIKRAMEILRKKLDTEGLFAPERKRPLPVFPQRIGLITSGTSAAYADFIKIINARWSGLTIVHADVTVQGPTAPDQLVGALEYFNQISPSVDVVVMVRGGGSIEDLQAFSTEQVARAVASSRTPIIVGVGHEVDFSLADYASDLRAATPTDAARLVVPDRTEISARINHLERRLSLGADQYIEYLQGRLERSVDLLGNYLRVPRGRVEQSEAALWFGLERIRAVQARTRQSLVSFEARMALSLNHRLNRDATRLDTLGRLLHGYDPSAVLGRGYAIVRQGKRIIQSSDQAKASDAIVIQLAKGSLEATVKETHS